MAEDQLARLVERAVADSAFLQRCVTDLDGTLAAENIQLGPEELEAVREFQREIAGVSLDDVHAKLKNPRRQGPL